MAEQWNVTTGQAGCLAVAVLAMVTRLRFSLDWIIVHQFDCSINFGIFLECPSSHVGPGSAVADNTQPRPTHKLFVLNPSNYHFSLGASPLPDSCCGSNLSCSWAPDQVHNPILTIVGEWSFVPLKNTNILNPKAICELDTDERGQALVSLWSP